MLHDERRSEWEGIFDNMKEEKKEETQAELESFYRGQLGIDDEAVLQKAVDASRIWDLTVGETLIREGVVPSHLYFLLQGAMRGVLLDDNGKDVTDCISCRPGETVMPDNDFNLPASVTMEVLEDSRVVVLPLELVRELLAEHPELMDIYRRQPDILCISCYLWNISYVRQVITETPKILPDVRIWLGGPEVSFDGREILQAHPCLTGVMCGEGEETFLELMEYYHRQPEKGADQMEAEQGAGGVCPGESLTLEQVRGIVYRDESGNIQVNPLRPVMDLSSVPFVYGHIEDFRNRIIYYESSRGCPFSCSYCLSSIEKSVRFRNPETVCRELQFFLDRRVPQVKFVDRTFNCRKSHAMAIWTYILEHDNGITNFHFEIEAELLCEEELELLSRMRPGLVQLEIGVQSANPKTLAAVSLPEDLPPPLGSLIPYFR